MVSVLSATIPPGPRAPMARVTESATAPAPATEVDRSMKVPATEPGINTVAPAGSQPQPAHDWVGPMGPTQSFLGLGR